MGMEVGKVFKQENLSTTLCIIAIALNFIWDQ